MSAMFPAILSFVLSLLVSASMSRQLKMQSGPILAGIGATLLASAATAILTGGAGLLIFIAAVAGAVVGVLALPPGRT